ncbi:DUF695 domain-containing protein [Daejeonella oryzae]|uniref:DUF695 domain-containing protein n=1 Tax=Daejeonella oryzae TaxID=1122943 RepID=UPI000401AF39|nr:DUF695 domain-containing protein [Daejeonella oryzae]
MFQDLRKPFFLLGILAVISCGQNNSKEKMKWFTTDTEYDGLPLYLRRPAHENIWKDKTRLPQLFCITHKLDKVKKNGLPESVYNKTLDGFDEELVYLFDPAKEGIIVLVETFAGKRNYWYYLSKATDYTTQVNRIKEKYPLHNILTSNQEDDDWGFIKEYPINLYGDK